MTTNAYRLPNTAKAVVFDVAFEPSEIYVGTAGDVSIVDCAGNTAVFKNCPAGSTIPCMATKVNTSGTVPVAGDLLRCRHTPVG